MALLALLLGRAPQAVAQELLSGSAESGLENVYPRPLAEEYRRQKVRAVLVLQQAIDRRATGQPLVSTPASYQEYDAQGRLVRSYLPQGGRLARRTDLTYDGSSGEDYATVTSYKRLDDPSDTTRLGRVWLPDTYASYPPAQGGTGLAAQWDEPTGDWRLTNRYRRWQSHDTTYLATTTPGFSDRILTLNRHYYVGANKHLLREDELIFNGPELREATYTYLRFNKERIEELGRLDFAKDYLDLPASRLAASPVALPRQRDELARHAQGQQLPVLTQTFDAHGWVKTRAMVDYGARIVYERTAQGLAQQCQQYLGEQLRQIGRFSYLPNGLLARATAIDIDKDGQPTTTLVYSYQYY